jgi:DNA gyrase/topoisomerase IV subunit A
MKKIPGPDFPTGGIIIGKEGLKSGYKGAKGIKIYFQIKKLGLVK